MGVGSVPGEPMIPLAHAQSDVSSTQLKPAPQSEAAVHGKR
jgi:hypothetical protein